MFGHTDNQQVDNSGIAGQQNPNPAASHSQNMHATNQVNPITGSHQNPLNEIPAAPDPFVQQTANPYAAQPNPAPIAQSNFGVASQPSAPISTATVAQDSDLLDLKQKALQELSPLVSHLEQKPEDKFKTTMMMIQASDDKTLLPAAYEAAQAITDETIKAQALLDIVNEINYFTQAQ